MATDTMSEIRKTFLNKIELNGFRNKIFGANEGHTFPMNCEDTTTADTEAPNSEGRKHAWNFSFERQTHGETTHPNRNDNTAQPELDVWSCIEYLV